MHSKSQFRRHLYYYIIILVIILVIFWSQLKEDVYDNISSYRKCLTDAYDNNIEPSLYFSAYRQCVKNFVNTDLEKFRMGRLNEDKVFLPLKSTFDHRQCIWLTVGIGGDDKVEELFKTKYPECHIYGIEAAASQYANFDKYGTIIPYGVGVKNETTELILRTNITYVHQKVEVLAFSYLLDRFIGSRLIHYMTIDIEGFEFGILEELLPSKILYEQNIIFCQIDAELHQNGTKIRDIMRKFDVDGSAYLPVFSTKFVEHEKVTWLNVENEECRKAFDMENIFFIK